MWISEIRVTQRSLRRAAQIPEMIETLNDGGALPPIVLARSDDGAIRVVDGHHRLSAYWLSGRERLGSGEFLLVDVEPADHRPHFGDIAGLLDSAR